MLVGSEVLHGKSFIREERITLSSSQDAPTIRWLREDRTGLFEVGTPPIPQGPAPYPVPYEARLLSYPIHRGARWTIDEARRITAEVVGHEQLDTPAGRFHAWKIRVRTAGHLPGEQAFVWYGQAGYLGMTVHVQFQRPDGNGDLITITTEQAEWIQAVDLKRREPRTHVITEARELLTAVLSAEQVYFQKYLEFAEVANNDEVRLKLGIDLGTADRRWGVSVSDISFTRLVARARGRNHSNADGILVTLTYERGEPLVWKVEKRRRGHH